MQHPKKIFSKIFSPVARFGATTTIFAPIGERVVTYHCQTMRGLAPRHAGRRDWEKNAPLGVRKIKAPLCKGGCQKRFIRTDFDWGIDPKQDNPSVTACRRRHLPLHKGGFGCGTARSAKHISRRRNAAHVEAALYTRGPIKNRRNYQP